MKTIIAALRGYRNGNSIGNSEIINTNQVDGAKEIKEAPSQSLNNSPLIELDYCVQKNRTDGLERFQGHLVSPDIRARSSSCFERNSSTFKRKSTQDLNKQ